MASTASYFWTRWKGGAGSRRPAEGGSANWRILPCLRMGKNLAFSPVRIAGQSGNLFVVVPITGGEAAPQLPNWGELGARNRFGRPDGALKSFFLFP